MKTEKEIREELRILKQLLEVGKDFFPSNKFIVSKTAIKSFEWVLEDSEE